jgi:nifR3 family TIM-barrel protein
MEQMKSLVGALHMAPMCGVTTWPFRVLVRRYGADFAWTEMVACEGIVRGCPATEAALHHLPEEDPACVQLVGGRPEALAASVQACQARGAQLIDLNAGCPVRKVIRQGHGVALMRDLGLLREALAALNASCQSPVRWTIKIRTGYDEANRNAVEVAELAQEIGAAGITVHARSRTGGYTQKPDWSIIRDVKNAIDIPVTGNGGIVDGDSALRMRAETGCDGLMVARAAQGRPWIFRQLRAVLDGRPQPAQPDAGELLDMMLWHVRCMVDDFGQRRGIIEMRKHLGWYLKGLPGARRWREKLHRVSTLQHVESCLQAIRLELGCQQPA